MTFSALATSSMVSRISHLPHYPSRLPSFTCFPAFGVWILRMSLAASFPALFTGCTFPTVATGYMFSYRLAVTHKFSSNKRNSYLALLTCFNFDFSATKTTNLLTQIYVDEPALASFVVPAFQLPYFACIETKM